MKDFGQGICNFCNTKFSYTAKHHRPTTSRKGKLFCSKDCLSDHRKQCYEVNRIEVSCFGCGKPELVTPTRAKKYKACSKECHGVWTSQNLKGRPKPATWHKKQKIAKQRENVRVEVECACENCGKTFQANTSLRAHKTHCKKGISAGDWICSICDKSCKTKNGLGNHKKWHTRTKEELRQIGENIRIGQAKSEFVMPRVSNAEIKFLDNLEQILDEKIERGYKIEGYPHEYDGYLLSQNLLIEFDGDYWHGNPALYDLTPRMKSQHWKDCKHNVKALSSDYNIIRVYQSQSYTLLEAIKKHGTIPKNQINQEKHKRDSSLRPSN